LFSYLEKLGIKTQTVNHKAVFTVEESQSIRQGFPGGHSKNLFLKEKNGKLWLVVAEENTRIDLKLLRKQIGATNLSFGKPELLWETLGVTPGSVTPFSLINDLENTVRVVLDQALVSEDTLYFHPLINTSTTQIDSKDFLTFIDKLGHDLQIIEI
jgi:Ala-tRNA(Pro) deacylase